jgi:hypothetical protein
VITTKATVEGALADAAAAVEALDAAEAALERRLRAAGAWAAYLDHDFALCAARTRLEDAARDGLARVVGAYLLEHGHGDAWRRLYPLLLSRFDLGAGWDAGYRPGDEVAFVEEAGHRARDAGAPGWQTGPEGG